MKEGSALAVSPTFSCYAAIASQQEANQKLEEINVEERFSFHRRPADHEGLTVSADQLFANGQIRPIFPIIKPHNLPVHSRHKSAPEAAPGTYSLWKPNSDHQMTPSERWKKMSSMGTSKFWRLGNLVRANNRDEKEPVPIIFRAFTRAKTRKAGEEKHDGSNSSRGSSKSPSPHEIHYTTNRSLKEVERRRSYLPYKKDIFGLFGNVSSWSKVKMFSHSRIHPQA